MTIAHLSLRGEYKIDKENDLPSTPEGYMIKGVLYVVVGLVGKLLSDLAKDQIESLQGI